ncbi:DoxX family protein [Nocardia sp. alder85J]|uniref:DoxX family protein n=1 Tax=Nocardia sp. alder85J TaxID=2862949 RepID=UPI001CD263FC|nr:DoxX family protein [Nocardia sp. alder85J]MCX4097031.1 DoxX family protein [Nocardia sp. alder85J]
MAPLVVLLVVTAVTRLAGWLHLTGWLDSWPHAARTGLAAMFLLTGIAHFTQPRRNGLIAMVPPRLPAPATLVTVTGVLELAGAAGVLIPPVAPVAAGCLAVLLVVMFPANIRAARADLGIKSMPLPLRTVVQVVFIGACVLVTL